MFAANFTMSILAVSCVLEQSAFITDKLHALFFHIFSPLSFAGLSSRWESTCMMPKTTPECCCKESGHYSKEMPSRASIATSEKWFEDATKDNKDGKGAFLFFKCTTILCTSYVCRPCEESTF